MINPEKFIKQLLQDTYPEMDAAAINLMTEDTLPVLQNWIFAKVADKLTIEQNAELADLMQDESFDMKIVYDYLNSHIENYPTWLDTLYHEFAHKYREEVNINSRN